MECKERNIRTKYKNEIKKIKTQKKHEVTNLNCKTKKAKEPKETK